MKKTTSPRSEPKQVERHVVGGFIQLTPVTSEQRTVRRAPLAARPGGRRASGACQACGEPAAGRWPIKLKSKRLSAAFHPELGLRLCAKCSWLSVGALETKLALEHARKLERGY